MLSISLGLSYEYNMFTNDVLQRKISNESIIYNQQL